MSGNKVELIGIPLKKASDVDVLKPLKNLITSRYQTHEQESYISSINEFAKLRSNAVCRTLDYHESSLETLYRYYDQIVAVETKIPASEVQIPFKWKDAFDKGSIFGGRISLTVSSLAYEKVCVLFNIAAMQSQVAAAQSLDTDESQKLAAKLLQSAAGVFGELKMTVLSSVQQDPTPDLQPETLTALASVVLAQAQEVFAAKAVADRRKDALIARLCAQCDDLYADALKNLQRESLKPLWERDWISKVAGKQAAYHALAQFHQSRVCNANKAVGEEIARLKYCIELFKTAQTRSGDLTLFAENVGRAQRALEEATKDNDFIYHERIPDVKSLSTIERAPLAKPVPVPEHFSSNFADLFESLVPVVVQQALVQYDVRKQELVNGEIGKLRESTQLLNSILASLNLPAAIEDTSGEKLPQSVRDKSSSVTSNGGVEGLKKMMSELPELLQRNKELLEESEKQLREEKESDEQLRTQFKERWTRTPSEKLTQNFQSNAEKYRKVIETAINADAQIKQKFEEHSEGMTLLSQGPDSLAAAMPLASQIQGGGNTPAADKLRQLMEAVETLKAERDAIECELKSSTADMREVFLSALAQDGAINEPALSTESLGRAFSPLQKQVKESLEHQETLVADIQSAHTEFCKATSGQGGDRETMLKKLASAFDTFNELRGNLNEGTKFYNDLTQLLVTFQSKINDFCFARRTEKEELLKDLTQGYASQGVGSTPNPPTHHQEAARVPPPRPPPPQSNPYQGAPQSAQPAPNPYSTQASAPGAPAAAEGQVPAAPVAPLPVAPPTGLPYPINPQGMPTPQGYVYQSYPVYTPMPQGYTGYNPYFQPPPPQGQPSQPGQPYPPYPQQPYGGYPYPPQQQQQWPSNK
ncbi:programmed cell death 6-interacting protein-like protein AliX [Oratosquilla oratoria]|uniref:programmed cell death 6-interacting protein-like protein AliX n=1 Tax=Oratosquilla oratoria TaxID=337810 RepID=UPI003F7695D0